MKLIEILIPTHFNDGALIPDSYHETWDNWICRKCGGLTLTKDIHSGVYINNGVRQKEQFIPVRVAAWPKDIPDILDYTTEYYDQESIFSYVVSNEVIIHKK